MMRYSFLLTVLFCLLGKAAEAQQTPATTRPNASANAVKPAAISADRAAGSAHSAKTTVPAPKPTTGATTRATPRNSTGTTNRNTTIPATTTRNASGNAVKPVKPLTAAVPRPVIRWMSIEEALEKSKTEKRKIFVDVYTDWCGWCKHMDSTTFTDAVVVNYLNEKYYAVKFNAEQTKDIQYKDKVYKFKKTGARGYHELAALWLNNRLSYPTVVVLSEDQDLIQPIPGYQDAGKMDAIIHYFGTDNHKKTPWEKYEKTYVRDQR